MAKPAEDPAPKLKVRLSPRSGSVPETRPPDTDTAVPGALPSGTVPENGPVIVGFSFALVIEIGTVTVALAPPASVTRTVACDDDDAS